MDIADIRREEQLAEKVQKALKALKNAKSMLDKVNASDRDSWSASAVIGEHVEYFTVPKGFLQQQLIYRVQACERALEKARR